MQITGKHAHKATQGQPLCHGCRSWAENVTAKARKTETHMPPVGVSQKARDP